jgi:hypothetical protein
MTRTPRTARALVAAVLVGVVTAGCAALPGPSAPVDDQAPASSAAPSPSPSDVAVPAADDVRSAGTAVGAEGRTLLHALALGGATIGTGSDEDPDVAVVRAEPGPSGGAVEVVLAAPTGGSIAVQDDGSLVVLDAEGTFVAGSARPTTEDGGGPVTVTAAGEELVRARADGGVLAVRVAGRALAGAEWGEREGGRSLAVAPTPWARTAGQAGELGVWTELVAAVPEADLPVMRDQLTCHVIGAPDKETWNLEPWRPDVGLLRVLAASCNPT